MVITKAYDLVRELMERVNRYPRSHKFVLGDRTLDTVYAVLDLLLEAKYTREKVALLDRANLVFPVKVRLPNPDLRLKPGMTAEVKLLVGNGNGQ